MSFQSLYATQHDLTLIAAYLRFKLFLIRSRCWAVTWFFECWFKLFFCNCLFLGGLNLVLSVELRCRLLFDIVNDLDQWFFKNSSNEYSLKKFICELLDSFSQIESFLDRLYASVYLWDQTFFDQQLCDVFYLQLAWIIDLAFSMLKPFLKHL